MILLNQPRELQKGTFRLDDGRFVLGRSPECDFELPHPTVSRRHAQLVVAGLAISVRDLDSRNGTFVDGQQVRQAELSLGQTLRLGSISFVLMDQEYGSDHPAWELDTASQRDSTLAPANAPALDGLSPAERRVACSILEGLTDKEIAKRLGITRHTVHHHVHEIFRFYKVHSRAELLVRLFRDGGSRGTP